jgi:hypothetical protein
VKAVERTRQQLDPVGALPTRILAVVLSVGALVYGVVMTIHTADQMVSPLLAALALVLLAAASLTVGLASSPHRAPFTAGTHMLVQFLAVGSVAVSAASQWGANRFIQDDFGSVSIGLLILALGVYRPARELASMGALTAIFVGFITLLKVPSLETDAPAVVFVLLAMAPVLALSFGSAAYSGRLVQELEKWQVHSAQSVASVPSQLMSDISKSVRQDRVDILARDVFPFFNSILDKGSATEADRVQAREIAESIRALMVAEADRTWLEVVAADDGVTPAEMHRSVVDVDGRATSMVAGQRTVLRALIVALHEDVSLVPGSMNVTITGTDTVNSGSLVARLGGANDDPLGAFLPYFAVMRVVFRELQVEYQDHELTVRFSYEQR